MDDDQYNFNDSNDQNTQETINERIRLPRNGEVIGIIEQFLGYCKMRVRCLDGKTRICRVPGRLTRELWLHEGDVIIVKPWEYQSDEKGDVIYKYKRNHINILKKKRFIKEESLDV